MRTNQSGRIVLTLLGALSLVVGLTMVGFAGPPKPSYSMSVPTQTVLSPSSGTAVADFSATIVAGVGGYTDPVALSFKDLPSGVTASWDDTPVVAVGSSSYEPTRHLFLVVPSTLKVGTYQFSIRSLNANTGKDAQDTKVTLGVAASETPSNSFTLGVTPTARTVQQGQTAAYSIQLNLPSGYTGGAVVLSSTGGPGGTTRTFAPASLATNGQLSTLFIPTTSKTKPGKYTVKISGKSNKTQRDVLVTLTIQAVGPSAGFTLATSPSQQQVAAGGTTSFVVGISRNSFSDPVALSVSGLPTSTTAFWEPAGPYVGVAATLTLTTDEVYTPDGSFDLTITGASGPLTRTVTAKLVVKTSNGVSVGISGDAQGILTMGGPAAPIDLRLSNPNDKPIWVTHLAVEVAGTNHPGCDALDFAVTLYTGAYPLLVAKRSSTTLSGLGLAQSQWPTVRLTNRLSNQEACKSVQVNLAYTATARQAG